VRAGAPLPTIYWDVGKVFKGTMSNAQVSFTAEGLAVRGVPVGGTILGPEGTTPVAAQLTFQSTQLSGPDAYNAAFTVASVATSPNVLGAFSIALPPGTYALRAVPTSNDALSATSFTIPVPSNTPPDRCVCALSRDLAHRAYLEGNVRTPTGQPLAGAFVLAAPSPAPTRSYLADTHTLDAATREVSATTDATGSLSLLADLGPSTLSVQPDPSTKMPWLVKPNLKVSSGDSQLPPLELTTPAFLGGKVVDPSGMPVTDALINAWLPVPAASGGSETTVKIATTSTDANGAFTLVLPSSI
jgi:protocatechuate 3,4-dioxygenase beta subunit